PVPTATPTTENANNSQDSGWTFYVPTTADPNDAITAGGQPGQPAYVDGTLVGFLQDATLQPTPAESDAKTGEPGAKQGESLSGAEKLGSKPEDRTLEFLRTQTVLLKPGESECDVGINYMVTENDFPVLLANGSGDIVGVTDAKFRIRQLSMPLEYRTGF